MFGEDGAVSETDIPGDIADDVEMIREAMVENIAESDEDLMEKYFEDGELSPEDITKGLQAGVASGELVPVVIASGLNNQGGQMILDAVQNLLPGPLTHKAWEGEEGERASSPDQPLACFVFKTLADPFAGQLTIVRVLSGELTSDSHLLNASNDGKERVGQLLLTSGKDQNQAEAAMGPGSIVTLAKLKNTATGDTLVGERIIHSEEA